MLVVKVSGTAKPQGSKNAYMRGGRIVLVEASKDLKPWREQVILAIQEQIGDWRKVEAQKPVMVTLQFHLPKPPSVKRFAAAVKPDVDKLARGILDAVTQSDLVWSDDAQVILLHAEKVYAVDEPFTKIVVQHA